MEIKVYFVDAITDKPFKGNPAVICRLDSGIDDKIMQNIAMEFNISETAFIYPISDTKNLIVLE